MKIPEIIVQEGKQAVVELAKTVKKSTNKNVTVPIVKEGADAIGDVIKISSNKAMTAAKSSDVVPTMSRAVRKSHAQTVRELQMIPKYLELATLENAGRFTTEEIELITSNFAKYKSDACLTDVIKEILDIGTKKGKPMTVKEISLYLEASTNLPKQKQENILKLVRAIKEREPITYDPKFIDEFWTYDKYKGLRHSKCDFIHETEDDIRASYKRFLAHEKQSAAWNVLYRDHMTGRNIDLEKEIFTPENVRFLRNYASNVKEPEFLSQLMLLTNPRKVLACADGLERIYKLSGNNMELVSSLAEVFTGDEIFQIALYLDKSKADILKSYSAGKARGTYNILKYLGLEGKIVPTPSRVHDDAMHHVMGRNFEGGKNRRH